MKTTLTLIIILFAFLPVRYLTEGSINIPWFARLNLETILATLLFVFMLIRILLSRVRKPDGALTNVISICFFVLLGVISASVVAIATDMNNGFRMLFRVSYPLVVYVYVLYDYRSPDEIKKFIKLFVMVGTFILIWAMTQNLIFHKGWQMSAGVWRYNWIGSGSDFGYNMGLAVLVNYVLFRSGEGKKYGLLSLLFAIQVLITVTRGCIFGTAVGVISYELFGRRGGLGSRSTIILMVIMILGTVVVFYPPLNTRIFAKNYKEMKSKEGSEQFAMSFEKSGRANAWRYAFNDTLTGYKLLFGNGIGTAEVDIEQVVGGLPHNEYVRILFEMGLMGLIMFIGTLCQFWILFRRCLCIANDKTEEWIAGLAIGVIALYSSGCLVDNMLSKYKSMGAVLFAFVAFAFIIVNLRNIESRQSAKNLPMDALPKIA